MQTIIFSKYHLVVSLVEARPRCRMGLWVGVVRLVGAKITSEV